jgi:TerC family integral membrane protein
LSLSSLISGEVALWVAFNAFVLGMLALDLGVFHRKSHAVGMREALIWSAVWIALALVFNVGVFLVRGGEAGLAFLTGYLVERALSIDNIFVFVLVFTYFQVPAQYQHRVLFWGILGALVMRALMIAAGVALIEQFHWVIYAFGAFLVFTGARLATGKEKEVHPERNPVVRLFRKVMPVAADDRSGGFFVRRAGAVMATPLFVVLLLIETSDLLFALDSIPAILAITTDPFVVYTSNVFAILGMRALYFAIAGLMTLFRYLNYGLSAVLVFVGLKMIGSDVYEVPIAVSLGVIFLLLAASVAASLWASRRDADTRGSEHPRSQTTVRATSERATEESRVRMER